MAHTSFARSPAFERANVRGKTDFFNEKKIETEIEARARWNWNVVSIETSSFNKA